MRAVIQEANHGTFDFTAEIHKEFGPKDDEHIRFWLLPRTDGMHGDHGHERSLAAGGADEVKYRPIAIDIYDTMRAGPTPKLAGDSAGTFVHIDGEMKDPTSIEAIHPGNPLGHYQSGFDRVIEVGPIPEGIEYDVTWLH